ncbi:LysR family hydrogen peroxide-inducible transcriptional activator [Ochrobactrum daejeonense]|uniref:LysR family hydrogen peroxide-inducible transcriptional activator n=2 Tax=Brucella daejeonensis TaxID=659015 RepID=A0A7W9B0J3_9HYPH|nr:LysR family hydrogen peroxide-inducible transcriptional activator [Brucella daejeonensis]
MKHLRYFDALAGIGHFGRAAEACSISQPALSVQIRELEELIGAPLVERGGRQIRLTSLGEAFAERVRGILRSVDELEELARATQGAFTGKLRLGIIPTVAPYLLPEIIKTLNVTYPGLEPRPKEAITQKLIHDLLEARLDAAIVALPVSEPALTEIPLFDEEFVLIRPLEDADKPVPSADKLHEMKLLLLEEGHCFRDQALSFCNIAAAPPREFMEGSSLSTLVQMVGAGIGVTLVPQMALDMETRSARICMSRLGPPHPVRTIGMVWRKTNPLSSQLAEIAQLVRQVGLGNQEKTEGLLAPTNVQAGK